MSTEPVFTPTPIFKAGNRVEIIDPENQYWGEDGSVIATSTTAQLSAVSVEIRTRPTVGAIWFRSDQLRRIKH